MSEKKDSKSGLRRLKPGEILFNDGEKANSLFIIQKGQLRLFKPKGKGFIEIAVLRAGEVIGEMAYFDDDGGGKRSCSASAMISSEVIEISFSAFAKTMSGLNPWFKTIINTLANRLRQTNTRVKELESNSATVNYSTGKHSGYEFFKTNDVLKLLGTLFLVFRSHGEERDGGVALHRKTLDLYAKEIYNLIESKMDEMIIVLESIGLLTTENDKDGLPKVLVLKNGDAIRSLFIFYNTEKYLTDDKKLEISPKCQMFLEKIHARAKSDPNNEQRLILVKIDDILEKFESDKLGVTVDTLAEAREQSLVGEVIVGAGKELSVETDFQRLNKVLPNIKFKNRIAEANQNKQ